MPKKLPPCPACNGKLPYDSNAAHDSTGVLVRLRECGCGYSRLERVTTVIEEYFPESAPVQTPRHPGEGGRLP